MSIRQCVDRGRNIESVSLLTLSVSLLLSIWFVSSDRKFTHNYCCLSFQVGTYLLALAAFNATASCGRTQRVPFYVVATTSKIMSRETLDSMRDAQLTDSFIVMPPQHPKGLFLSPEDYEWEVLSPSLISKGIALQTGMNRETFLKTDNGNASCGMEFNIPQHCIDPKSPFGVVLEGRDPNELRKAWEAYGLMLSTEVAIDNVYSEVREREDDTSVCVGVFNDPFFPFSIDDTRLFGFWLHN